MNAKPLCIALLAVSLSACAHSPNSGPAEKVAAAPAAGKSGLTEQVLYQFLLGEIASQRGDLRLSAEAFTDLAERTKDARVARRATELALYARQPELALRNARLWHQLEPDAPKALQTLVSLLVGGGRAAEAKPYLESWIKTGKGGEPFLQLHGLLARHKDKQVVLDLISELATGFPAMPEARYAVAQAALQAANWPRALAALDEALRLKPGWESAALLKAQILQQTGEEADLLDFFRDFLATEPGAREVRLAYARQLARAARYQESRVQFEALAQERPDNPETHFSIGLVALQTNDLESARASLLKALELKHPDEGNVRYYLGQLAEARNDFNDALTWYRSIDKGRQYFDAQLRVAVALAKLGRLDEARGWLKSLSTEDDGERIQVLQAVAQIERETGNFQVVFDLLSEGLRNYPDTPELLYDRAMAAEKLDRLDVLETDLRRLIELRPDYAHAYNALGYTLADRTTRLDEAIKLLEVAISLAPDDAFIQDSMGWALYRLGRLNEAVDYLRRAHAGKPDPEIAAHLGEVLWKLGEHEEARRVWDSSLKLHPDSESLRETTSRLMP